MENDDKGQMLHNAKAMRSSQTEAEQRLWYHLRAHRFMSLKFKRQKPIGRYIVDFVCVERRLIIELDGGQHAEQTAYDQQRDAWLSNLGYRVLRFWNNDVMQQLEGVLETIHSALSLSTSQTAPLPQPASHPSLRSPHKWERGAAIISSPSEEKGIIPSPLQGEG